jgi:hypothetical protein
MKRGVSRYRNVLAGLGGLFALSAALLQPVYAADLRQVGPQASASQIVAARGGGEQPVLRLTFTVSGAGRAATPESFSADLAPDYLLVRYGAGTTLYDYKLRRVIHLDEATHSFLNDSLYGLADFRMAETYNRRMLREALARASLPAAIDDDFWIQSELHAVSKADPAPSLDQQSTGDGGARFLYKGSEAAGFIPSDQRLTPDDKVGLRHLLLEQSVMHSAIITALISTERVPRKVSFAWPPSRKKTPETWMLQSAARVSTAYPLTAAYAVVPLAQRRDLSALATILPVMQKAQAGQDGAHSVAQYREAIDEALEQHAGLQAALLAFEAMEQYGQQSLDCSSPQKSCHSLKEIFTEAQKNERANALLRSLGLERTDREQAIGIIRAIRHDDVRNGYVLDDFTGNMMGQAGKQSEAVPLVINAVRGDPYVAGYYKDLGDLFRTSFQPGPAWTCYDLGRLLPGGATAPVIDSITEYENKLASDYPQFF